MPNPQFHIGLKNKVTADASDGVLELHFLDTIQDREVFDWYSMTVTTESLVSQVMDQLNAYKPKKILLKIDSWGGDADAGKGVYNVIKSYPAKVETDIINKAASAATVIACAGSKITMPKTGMYVIHQASNSAEGTAKDLRAAADVADLYTDTYCEIYSSENRKGKTKDEIKALIADGDYWMTGEQAEEMGFIDECYNNESVNVTANIEAAKSQYKDGKIPASLAKITASLNITEETEESTLSQIKNELMKFSDKVTAFLNGKKVTAKATDSVVDITAVVQPLFVELVAEMETEVTAEIGRVTTEVTTAVTAAMEEKYGKVITELKKEVTDLTADVINIAGAESRPGAKSTPAPNGKKERPSLAGEPA